MNLETKRLIITKFTMDMVMAVHENSLDEDTRKFVPDEVFETLEDARETVEFLMSQYDDGDGPLVYPILIKETKENIGYVQLVPIDDDMYEIGYHIGNKYTNNGYATEAVKEFLPYIANKKGIDKIYGICLSENKASIAVLKKCGFNIYFEGVGEYHEEERNIVKSIWQKGAI